MAVIVDPQLTGEDDCLQALADLGRLRAVAAYLDHADDAAVQTYVRHVADLLHATSSVIHLIGDSAVLVVASHGLTGWHAAAGGMPAHWAPCHLVVQHQATILITDTHLDPRHTNNPAVSISGLRSYAGVPLRTSEGHIIGTLCVLHEQPHAFDTTDLDTLTALAPQALHLLRPTTT